MKFGKVSIITVVLGIILGLLLGRLTENKMEQEYYRRIWDKCMADTGHQSLCDNYILELQKAEWWEQPSVGFTWPPQAAKPVVPVTPTPTPNYDGNA